MDESPAHLTPQVLQETRQRIEAAIVPAMARTYGHGGTEPPPGFGPGLKPIERIVSYYDYAACGVWSVPLRRLLLHLALAYRVLEPRLGPAEKQRYRDLVDTQVALAIEHCRHFLPGRTDLHLAGVNNHMAIFMQGVYYCGQVFGRPDWVSLTREFAERYYASGHPDGYFEEHTNAEREGGPSLVYTPLTAGAWASYGLALHSLTPRGRTFVAESLAAMDVDSTSPEALAVVHHEVAFEFAAPRATG